MSCDVFKIFTYVVPSHNTNLSKMHKHWGSFLTHCSCRTYPRAIQSHQCCLPPPPPCPPHPCPPHPCLSLHSLQSQACQILMPLWPWLFLWPKVYFLSSSCSHLTAFLF